MAACFASAWLICIGFVELSGAGTMTVPAASEIGELENGPTIGLLGDYLIAR